MVSYADWEWLGAPLALDLANTRPEPRPGEPVDLLAGDDGVRAWLDREAPRVGRVRAGAELAGSIRELRDALHALVSAAASGDPLPSGAIDAVNAAARRCPGHAALAVEDGRPVAVHHTDARGAARLLGTIARSAIELLGGPDRERLRRCGAPGCGMHFVATRRQAWCSPECGNRVRAARHYARTRTSRA